MGGSLRSGTTFFRPVGGRESNDLRLDFSDECNTC